MQRSTDGSPASPERRASLWQYWQSILYVCTCTTWGKSIGWTEGRATAGWRLQEDTATKIRTARSTTPSAPTPAFAPIDDRSPSGGLENACEPYHAVTDGVNPPGPLRASPRPPRARAARPPPRGGRAGRTAPPNLIPP